ncbi:MFS transporter [Nonomuraea roseoviolacea]|uniref:MFS family arabinose efflux permease n=1 Tax=Nonomuraea roseoviolacea subsp. carminata TaxID=160689 RepID=A0ABT1K9Y8_9ACTN|nr:MFS transporter [Nonomuraea roseoviolacea]MCP2350837.1 putative MFS family arabinose efflux permease [Nonomuraea roseoviolacea subsp. carminata]
MTAPAEPVALVRPPFALSAASLVSSFDRFAVGPMLVLIALDLRVTLAAAVAAASGYYLAYGLSQPLWGVLSDRYGRVPVMRGALLGATAAGLASAFMPGLIPLVALRVVAGACFGAVIPTSLTYVGDTVAAPIRQRALSDLMGATALGTAVATGFGGVLADLVSWRVVFTTAALCALACALGLRSVPEPPRGAVAGLGAHLGAVLRERWALLVFGLAFVEGAVLLGLLPFLATALQHHGVTAAVAGLATAVYGVGLWLLTRLVKRVSRRRPAPLLIAVGGAQLCLGHALVAVHVSLATVTVAALLFGGGWSFMHSSLQTWATSAVPHARGTAVAFFAAALFIGSAVSSSAAGPLAGAGAYGPLFGVAAAVALPLTAVAALTRRRWRAP